MPQALREVYPAKLISVTDGDTQTYELSTDTFHFLKCKASVVVKCRLAHVNCPDKQPAREQVKQAVIKKLVGDLTVEITGISKFGYPLVVVRLADQTSVNQWLLDNNLGMPYEGEEPRPLMYKKEEINDFPN